jgi:hypothetical protein
VKATVSSLPATMTLSDGTVIELPPENAPTHSNTVRKITGNTILAGLGKRRRRDHGCRSAN